MPVINSETFINALADVSKAKYDAFKKYIDKNEITELSLRYAVHYSVDYNGGFGNFLRHLGKALKDTRVASVSLRSNEIGNEDAIAFCKSLKDANQVTSVSFAGNKIDDIGAKDLGIALKDTGVTSIDLSSNLLGDQGAVAFCNVIKDNPITSVVLDWNKISAKGAKDIVVTLKHSNVAVLSLLASSSYSLRERRSIDHELIRTNIRQFNGRDVTLLKKIYNSSFQKEREERKWFLMYIGLAALGFCHTFKLVDLYKVVTLGSRSLTVGAVGLAAIGFTYALSIARKCFINYCGKQYQSAELAVKNDSWRKSAYQAGLDSMDWAGYTKSFFKPSAYILNSYYAGLSHTQYYSSPDDFTSSTPSTNPKPNR